MYISILLLQLMFLWGKNKSRSSGFQHNIEKFGILVKCQVFLAALTLEKSAFEKEDNYYLLVYEWVQNEYTKFVQTVGEWSTWY